MRSRGKYGAVPTGKRNKYGVRTDAIGKLARTVDGITFASQAECKRYQELRLLAAGGRIRGLKLQPRYKLYAMVIDGWADGKEVCVYVADFEYEESIPGSRCCVRTVTEDVKGMETPVFKLKAKFFAACYGREVRITR